MKKSVRCKKNFRDNQQGAVALIIAISLALLLFGVLALSIDMNRTQTSYTDMQGATDASAYGTAEWLLKEYIANLNNPSWIEPATPTDVGVTNFARRILKANFQRDNNNAVYDESSLVVKHEISNTQAAGDAKTHIITVSACADLSTKFADAAHMTDQKNKEQDKDTRVCTTSQARFDVGKLVNTEVAFALDYTESMFWNGVSQSCPLPPNSCPAYPNTKAYNLKVAMDNVLDNYFSNNADSKAYASIIPFAGAVNLYPYNKTMVRQNNNFAKYLPSGQNIYIYIDDSNNVQTISSGSFIDKNALSFSNYQFVDGKAGNYNMLFTTDQNNGFESQIGISVNGTFNTKDYTYVLNRIPTIDQDLFDKIINSNPKASSGSSGSNKTFYNYYDLLENLKSETIVPDSWKKTFNEEYLGRSKVDQYNWSPNGTETIRMGQCYNGAVGAMLDQRIERREKPSYDNSGIVKSATAMSNRPAQNGRNLELHESFPIQPLTNNLDVLKRTLARFTDTTYLYGSNNNLDQSKIIDGQTSRINRSRWFSAITRTNSSQGLMWGWFSLSKFWQGKWNAKSLNEDYFDADLGLSIGSISQQSRTKSGNELPSKENAKHLILITDGYDIDGQQALSSPYSSNAAKPMGYYNSCDAFMPVRSFSDGSDNPSDNYQKLCKRIKDEGIKIHIILYGFQGVGPNDPSVKKYKACASDGELYISPNPNQLPDNFEAIFTKILSDANQVRIVK